MAEYIECKAAINRIKEYASDVYGIDLDDAKQFSGDSLAENYCEGLYEATELIDDMPTADVAPVRHGRWELLRKGDWTSVFVCSVCGRRETIAESESYNSQLKMPKKYPYCHCGAKMDGETEGNDG